MIGRAIIRDLFDRDRAASMIGLVIAVMVVAPMISPLIGGIARHQRSAGTRSSIVHRRCRRIIVVAVGMLDAAGDAARRAANGRQRLCSATSARCSASRALHRLRAVPAARVGDHSSSSSAADRMSSSRRWRRSTAEYGVWFATDPASATWSAI